MGSLTATYKHTVGDETIHEATVEVRDLPVEVAAAISALRLRMPRSTTTTPLPTADYRRITLTGDISEFENPYGFHTLEYLLFPGQDKVIVGYFETE